MKIFCGFYIEMFTFLKDLYDEKSKKNFVGRFPLGLL